METTRTVSSVPYRTDTQLITSSVKCLSRGQTIDKLANFCGRGLVSLENRLIKSLNHDTHHFLGHDSDDKKMADDKDAHSSMLLVIVTAKRNKKRTVWVRHWLLDIAGRAFVLKLTGQRVSACNSIYQLRRSDITGLSVNKLLANHSSAFQEVARFSRRE